MHWILNPDAELELARPEGYTTAKPAILAMARNADKFVWLTEIDPSFLVEPISSGRGEPALLWCPTPSAQKRALVAGFTIPEAPSLNVLQTANSKVNLLQAALPGPKLRAYVRTAEELTSICHQLDANEAVRAKRGFAFAGRNQRRLGRILRPDDQRYIADSLRTGGLLVESQQTIFREWSIHGVVWGGSASFGGKAAFELTLGRPCQLTLDEYGSVSRIEASDGAPSVLPSFAEQAALWLFQVGYFGPFGLDVIEGDHGLVASDLNARFTLGWSIGLGAARNPTLERMFASA
jgi:hypothetical protein